MNTEQTPTPRKTSIELPSLDPGGGRRPPSQVSRENSVATEARILRDEHRSDNGQCVRCEVPWPCSMTVAAAYGVSP
ncbi:hypothetical protein AB0O91_20935 [Kitasatospora sp. NPDC089797]|uniref:hypothetical protein n=1 Tax=Kitasatospora sp. NPDC089797 TaxID=3155298 RepID=UPI00343FA23E